MFSKPLLFLTQLSCRQQSFISVFTHLYLFLAGYQSIHDRLKANKTEQQSAGLKRGELQSSEGALHKRTFTLGVQSAALWDGVECVERAHTGRSFTDTRGGTRQRHLLSQEAPSHVHYCLCARVPRSCCPYLLKLWRLGTPFFQASCTTRVLCLKKGILI